MSPFRQGPHIRTVAVVILSVYHPKEGTFLLNHKKLFTLVSGNILLWRISHDWLQTLALDNILDQKFWIVENFWVIHLHHKPFKQEPFQMFPGNSMSPLWYCAPCFFFRSPLQEVLELLRFFACWLVSLLHCADVGYWTATISLISWVSHWLRVSIYSVTGISMSLFSCFNAMQQLATAEILLVNSTAKRSKKFFASFFPTSSFAWMAWLFFKVGHWLM